MQKFGIERIEDCKSKKVEEELQSLKSRSEANVVKPKSENTQLSDNLLLQEERDLDRAQEIDKDGSKKLEKHKPFELENILKKKRRTKNGAGNRNFLCSICQRAYFSYPALYTHKRNKHNIIPITGKDEIFKNVLEKKQNLKFKYSALENDNWIFSDLMDTIINYYKEILNQLFSNKSCILYQNYFNNEEHIGLKILKKIKANKSKLMVPHPDTFPCIDEILIIYLVHFIKVTQDQFLIEMTARFVILFREHLNISGWDNKRQFLEMGIQLKYNFVGPYTLCNDCEDVPDFVNNFISVFVNMDSNFKIGENELIDITKNFCNWLFVNNLTSFKICNNDFDELEGN